MSLETILSSLIQLATLDKEGRSPAALKAHTDQGKAQESSMPSNPQFAAERKKIDAAKASKSQAQAQQIYSQGAYQFQAPNPNRDLQEVSEVKAAFGGIPPVPTPVPVPVQETPVPVQKEPVPVQEAGTPASTPATTPAPVAEPPQQDENQKIDAEVKGLGENYITGDGVLKSIDEKREATEKRRRQLSDKYFKEDEVPSILAGGAATGDAYLDSKKTRAVLDGLKAKGRAYEEKLNALKKTMSPELFQTMQQTISDYLVEMKVADGVSPINKQRVKQLLSQTPSENTMLAETLLQKAASITLPERPRSTLDNMGFAGKLLYTIGAIRNPAAIGVELAKDLEEQKENNKWNFEQNLKIQKQYIDSATSLINLEISRANSAVARANALLKMEEIKNLAATQKADNIKIMMDALATFTSNYIDLYNTAKEKAIFEANLEISKESIGQAATKNFTEGARKVREEARTALTREEERELYELDKRYSEAFKNKNERDKVHYQKMMDHYNIRYNPQTGKTDPVAMALLKSQLKRGEIKYSKELGKKLDREEAEQKLTETAPVGTIIYIDPSTKLSKEEKRVKRMQFLKAQRDPKGNNVIPKYIKKGVKAYAVFGQNTKEAKRFKAKEMIYDTYTKLRDRSKVLVKDPSFFSKKSSLVQKRLLVSDAVSLGYYFAEAKHGEVGKKAKDDFLAGISAAVGEGPLYNEIERLVFKEDGLILESVRDIGALLPGSTKAVSILQEAFLKKISASLDRTFPAVAGWTNQHKFIQTRLNEAKEDLVKEYQYRKLPLKYTVFPTEIKGKGFTAKAKKK